MIALEHENACLLDLFEIMNVVSGDLIVDLEAKGVTWRRPWHPRPFAYNASVGIAHPKDEHHAAATKNSACNVKHNVTQRNDSALYACIA